MDTLTRPECDCGFHKAGRFFSILTAVIAFALLYLGSQVTTHGAGMADPVWPTLPWYLLENLEVFNQEGKKGFVLEHSHRLLGWIVGGLASITAISFWLAERNTLMRWMGLGTTISLIGIYGEFHRQMMEVKSSFQATGSLEWPSAIGMATAAVAFFSVALGFTVALSGRRGGGARLVSSLALVFVMIQGLLGGFRVYLDSKMGLRDSLGLELAQVHGIYGQIVFALLVCLPFMAANRTSGDALSSSTRKRLTGLCHTFMTAMIFQLVFGAMTRHTGTGLSQRLHLMTAFLVTITTVWLAVRTLSIAESRQKMGTLARILVGIVLFQVLLGVEAWMGKFAATGKEATVAPLLRTATPHIVAIRTLHVLCGAVLLATGVVYAVKVSRREIGGETN